MSAFHVALMALLVMGTVAKTLTFHSQKNIYTWRVSNRICYGVMFDAGSSGTRVYVYKWQCREQQSTPKVVITEEIPNKSIRPGISSYAANPTEAGASLLPLIEFANTIVPSSQKHTTPIFLRATAGMRLLTIAQQDAILDNIRDTFRQSGFRFDEDSWARVITGVEEGAYGWVAANYLYNKIDGNVAPQSTNAVMDCGGASVQLTFAQPRQPFINKLDINFPDINHYTVYTYSYLGYGQDQARNEVIRASMTNPNVSVVESPCFNTGFNATKVATFNPDLRILGTGSLVDCRAQVKKYLNLTEGCTDCSIGGNYQPPVPEAMALSAMNSFVFVSDFFDLGDSYSIDMLASSSDKFCSMSWSDVITKYKMDEFLSTRCFSAALIAELTTNAFGVGKNRRISAKNKIGNVTVAWTLGSMLYDMALIPCRMGTEECIYDDHVMRILMYTLPVCAAGAVLIILIIGVLLIRRKRQRTYIPL